MTDNNSQVVSRGILQSRDINLPRTEATTPSKKPLVISTPQSTNTVTAPSPSTDYESETEEYESPEKRFNEVCKFRVAEDLSGELADLGIEEWSVDDFDFIERLGSGTAGTVFRAREKTSRYEVALKVQEYDYQDITSDVELDIYCGLGTHQNVSRMIDYFYSDQTFGESQQGDASEDEKKEYLYMILELCDMGSLFDVIERNQEGGWLDEDEAAQYFKGCLRGVQYFHERGWIHCDIKTANFLVDHNDDVKLADFGMAVPADKREVLGGTPVFMAPEHLRAWQNGGDDFDHRVDIYGLGVTLFQMLVGDFPFYVIENDEDNKNADSLFACYGRLTLADARDGFDPKRLDLRVLNDRNSTETFTFPEISFPDCMSEEAIDLVASLMEPDPNRRITLEAALDHVWFQRYV